MNTLKNKLVLCSVLFIGSMAFAAAQIPAEITELTTNVDTVWTSAKTIILAVATFSILMTFVYKMRSRRG